MNFSTADLHDVHEGRVQVVLPGLRDFGGCSRFHGPISTVQVKDDNTLVRAALEEPGEKRVLVVDGGGSLSCALLGDILAGLALKNGWSGVVIHGCVRDVATLRELNIGIKALASNPKKSLKKGKGDRDRAVVFLGVTFRPGEYLYADEDGILASSETLF